jgi:hypothetical protein
MAEQSDAQKAEQELRKQEQNDKKTAADGARRNQEQNDKKA